MVLFLGPITASLIPSLLGALTGKRVVLPGSRPSLPRLALLRIDSTRYLGKILMPLSNKNIEKLSSYVF